MNLFRREEAFRVLVITVMMACLASSAAEVASRVIPGFDPALLVGLSFLVCLEGIVTDRMARQLPEASLRLRLHVVEWVVILLLLRLVLSVSQGLDALAFAAGRWLARPQSLVDGGLVGAAALLFLVWWLGLKMSQAVEALGPEAEAPPPRDSPAYYAWLTRPKADGRSEGWAFLVHLFLVGGVVLLVCSGLARLDVEAALSLKHTAIAGIVGNALLYFVLGFTLLAQGHYAILRASWARNEVAVSGPLARRWAALGLGFAVGVALLVLSLPTRPSLALFSAVFDALMLVFYYVYSVLTAIVVLVAYLLSLLFRLLGRPSGREEPLPPPEFTPPPPQPPAQPVAWWEAIQGLMLWAAITAVVIYALVRFVRERSALWQELGARRGPLRWIAGVLAGLWRWLTRTGGEVGARLRALVSRAPRADEERQARRRLAWLRPRNLREQVRLLYMVALHQAAGEGWARQGPDTPYEYLQRLAPNLPEGQGDLEALTQAFVEARYSRREFAPAEVSPLRAALRRLRRTIASLRAPSRGPGGEQAARGEER